MFEITGWLVQLAFLLFVILVAAVLFDKVTSIGEKDRKHKL